MFMPLYSQMSSEEKNSFLQKVAALIVDSGLEGIYLSEEGEYVLMVK